VSHHIRTVRTAAAPAPVAGAPYSQGIDVTGTRMVFASGQVPVDPATGALEGDDVGTQTRRVLANLRAVLEGGGASLRDVVKTTVFLTDLAADFGTMNAVYAEVFAGHAPARSTVGVAALPLGARVEIEAVAVIDESEDD
jgi:2-iminobutanoate/2-iminopropanoate deaminase